MDAVKEYWSDKTFLLGMFFCVIGTILGAIGVVTPAVLIEVIGILLMMYVIYKIDKKSATSH
ncbi:conserved hypothetical protein [Lebetimonas natsushimae]|uniref:Uncharacterized protein n=1 Tax=Lebetimonas natsushimae TaxID=1936991 RepID=A0A292YG18_9BACT|nr:hypothetical protein [Lebetimonas natsushimae]GAX87910.1 conserved hypothetical protein [Lebetimonas natsushimae]